MLTKEANRQNSMHHTTITKHIIVNDNHPLRIRKQQSLCLVTFAMFHPGVLTRDATMATYMTSIPSVYNTATAVTSDDIDPALLVLEALLLVELLVEVSSGAPTSPLADVFCTCSDDDWVVPYVSGDQRKQT